MVDPSQGRGLGRGATTVNLPSNHKAVLPKGSTWEGGARQNPSSPPLPTCCSRALSLNEQVTYKRGVAPEVIIANMAAL